MTTLKLELRPGRRHAAASLIVALVVVAVVVSASPFSSEIGGRLAVGALGFFALTVAIGSRGLVGLSSIPMLGAVLAASTQSEPAWVRSIVIGCLWYVAVELAWESIERRTGGIRTAAVGQRRVNEVATAVTLALVVTTVGLVLSDVAPQRTLLTQGPIILGIFTVIALGTRLLERDRSRAGD